MNGQTASSTVPRNERSALEEAMNRLAGTIHMAQDVFFSLDSRLLPIRAIKPIGENVGAKEVESSNLVENINKASGKVESLTNQMKRLIDELQI